MCFDRLYGSLRSWGAWGSFNCNINSDFSRVLSSGSWLSLGISLFLITSLEVFLPVIFVFGEVLVKVSILMLMVLALPLHLECVWVFNVVIRVAVVTVTVVSAFMLIVPLRLVVAVQIMCFVMISVPSLLLFIVIFA